MKKGAIAQFIERHFKHFNAATVLDAAKAYDEQLAMGIQ